RYPSSGGQLLWLAEKISQQVDRRNGKFVMVEQVFEGIDPCLYLQELMGKTPTSSAELHEVIPLAKLGSNEDLTLLILLAMCAKWDCLSIAGSGPDLWHISFIHDELMYISFRTAVAKDHPASAWLEDAVPLSPDQFWWKSKKGK